MFAGGGAGFQKQSKPPWENVNLNSEVTPSWWVKNLRCIFYHGLLLFLLKYLLKSQQ